MGSTESHQTLKEILQATELPIYTYDEKTQGQAFDYAFDQIVYGLRKWLEQKQNKVQDAIFLNNKFCQEHELDIKIIKDIFIDELIKELSL